MTQQERDQRLEELRRQYKLELDPVKRKIIEVRGKLLKKSYTTPTQIKI